MNIGPITLDNKTIFAPLAGITNLPLRLLAKACGCGLVCSEMISANGLVHKSKKTLRMLDSAPAEKPLSVQIFGADPAIMAEAAGIVAESGADIIDVNMGCSVKKVTKTGSGVALMRTPDTAAALLTAVRRAVALPLTIKIRTGWEKSGWQAFEIARIAQDCGVDAIALHPRTASQGFRGCADWQMIGRLKQALSIPVIGNGDIVYPADAVRMIEQTGCDAVMIGRAAIGNPWIFAQINALLAGETPVLPDIQQRRQIMQQFLSDTVTYFGEKQACRMMRSRLGWFTKGLRGSRYFREAIKQVASHDRAADLIDRFMDRAQQSRKISNSAPPFGGVERHPDVNPG